jgi:hypothetical protein
MVAAMKNAVSSLFLGATVLWFTQPECTLADGGGNDDEFTEASNPMVEKQLADRGITDKRVLKAMGEVPRHPAGALRADER